nr:DNA-binding response regulator [Vibrio sp. JC009]
MTANIRYEGLSVLIVDKDPEVRKSLSGVLHMFFTQVSSASGLEQAELLCEQTHYDIVLLDIDFPERSGIEWYETLKNRDNSVDTCIIFMASYGELTTAIDAMKVGACDFIIKPFSIEKIINAVQSCAAKIMAQKIRFALAKQTASIPSKQPIHNSAEFTQAHSVNPSHNTTPDLSVSIPDLYEKSNTKGYPNEWTLKEVEKAHIIQVVNHHDGNKSAAAKMLGVARKTLERKFKEWDK